MIVVLDADQARQDVAAGRLACACGKPFKPWGCARTRSIRQADGRSLVVRPDRVRCRSCKVTHVLVPAGCVPRSAYAVDVVGQALMAKALGHGHRVVAARLDVPEATVRGWLRRARRGAEQLRRHATALLVDYDPDPPALAPTTSLLGDALNALVAAAVAAARRFDLAYLPFWQVAAMLAAGRLVPPTRSS